MFSLCSTIQARVTAIVYSHVDSRTSGHGSQADSETSMASSLSFPQEIVDTIIGTFDVHDRFTLKRCALVSRSFLIPSRKRIFSVLSIRNEQQCQKLYCFLTQNPYIQSSVTSLSIDAAAAYGLRNGIGSEAALPILRLSFRCLRRLSIGAYEPNYLDWSVLGSDIRNALWDLIHSSPLTSLSLQCILNLPIDLSHGLTRIREIELYDVSLDIFHKEQHKAKTANFLKENNSPIERFTWSFHDRVESM
jgi:hypothetical protein